MAALNVPHKSAMAQAGRSTPATLNKVYPHTMTGKRVKVNDMAVVTKDLSRMGRAKYSISNMFIPSKREPEKTSEEGHTGGGETLSGTAG